MEKAIIREMKRKDLPCIKRLVFEAWDWHDMVKDKKTLEQTINLYYNQVLYGVSFAKVATLNDKVVGLIFGRVNKKEPKYRDFLDDAGSIAFSVLGAGDEDRKNIHEYFTKLKKAYRKLIEGIENNYDGSVDFFITDPKLHGKGVGKKLWCSLKEHFMENNAKKIFLYTDSDCNFAFYEKAGFNRKRVEKTTFNYEAGAITDEIYLYDYEF